MIVVGLVIYLKKPGAELDNIRTLILFLFFIKNFDGSSYYSI